MFKVGKHYTIILRENGENTEYPSCQVLAVTMPLIKVKKGDGEEAIYNTGSLSFVSASEDK